MRHLDIRAVAFDVNGTLVDILTEDGADQVFRAAGHWLTYQGIDLRRHQLHDLYFERLKAQQTASSEQYPEFDAVQIWRSIVVEYGTDFTRALPAPKLDQLPLVLAELTRGVARRRLKLFPHVRAVLDELRTRFPLEVVTDAQSAYARAELHRAGIDGYFDPIIVSGDHGFRKPDPRLFQFAVDGLGVAAEHTLYVGNDIYRDVYGAAQAGLRTVMFHSEHGSKHHRDTAPDFAISDHRELLAILETGPA